MPGATCCETLRSRRGIERARGRVGSMRFAIIKELRAALRGNIGSHTAEESDQSGLSRTEMHDVWRP
jgi:hypothetical protein